MLRRKQLAVALVMIPLVSVVAKFLPAQVTKIPVTAEEKSAASSSSENARMLMHAKLVHSQKVLEGLVTHDFPAIERAAAAMSKISLNPPPDLSKAGDKTDEQVYEHFRMEFARLAGQLESHARRKELEATAYVQQNLTATCIACHDYIRDYP